MVSEFCVSSDPYKITLRKGDMNFLLEYKWKSFLKEVKCNSGSLYFEFYISSSSQSSLNSLGFSLVSFLKFFLAVLERYIFNIRLLRQYSLTNMIIVELVLFCKNILQKFVVWNVDRMIFRFVMILLLRYWQDDTKLFSFHIH